MRKVIFIDIDGVLNSEINQDLNFKQGRWFSHNLILDPEAMLCLKEIIDQTGAELILSSTWRYPDEDGSFASKENFINQLSSYDLSLSGETPQLPEYDRAAEISEYLDEHMDIGHFVVIDDDIDLLKNEEIKPHILHTNHQFGLVKSEIAEAVSILNKSRMVSLDSIIRYASYLEADSYSSEVSTSHSLSEKEKELLQQFFSADNDEEAKMILKKLVHEGAKRE